MHQSILISAGIGGSGVYTMGPKQAKGIKAAGHLPQKLLYMLSKFCFLFALKFVKYLD